MAKILLVEDSESVAEMLLILLQMNGHATAVSFTKKEASEKIISFSPDLILIDVWLNDGNGKDLCKEVRSVNKKVPIILMSANANLLQDYELCEANDIIEKPFDINHVINKIDNLLQ